MMGREWIIDKRGSGGCCLEQCCDRLRDTTSHNDKDFDRQQGTKMGARGIGPPREKSSTSSPDDSATPVLVRRRNDQQHNNTVDGDEMQSRMLEFDGYGRTRTRGSHAASLAILYKRTTICRSLTRGSPGARRFSAQPR